MFLLLLPGFKKEQRQEWGKKGILMDNFIKRTNFCPNFQTSKIFGHDFYSLRNVLSSVPALAMKSDVQLRVKVSLNDETNLSSPLQENL